MEKNNSIYRTTMTCGLALGIVLALFHLVPNLMGIMQPPTWLSLLSYVVVIVGIVYGQIRHRDYDLGGYITYGRSFGVGMLIMLFAAVVYAFYFIIFVKVIDPEFISKMIEFSQEMLYESGMPEEQIELAMQVTSKMMTPMMILFSSIFGYALCGAIFSLITSAFVKKEEPMFKNIENE